MKKRRNKNSERGIALLVALFALVLIAAIGLGMMFSSDSELGVNQSFRQNHLAYFAARSGLEEARDRMRYSSGTGISGLLPTTSLGQAGSALYIVNVAGVDPTSFGNNTYFDDELCHDLNNPLLIANSPGAFNIKCPHNAGSVPTTAGWNTNIAAEPIAGGGTIPYAWTRINLKMQESTNPWCVLGLGNCTQQAPLGVPANPLADQVCYDGNREFVLADAVPLRDAPGGIGGLSLPSQLAMGMYFGGTTGHGNSGHSGTGTSTTSSTTGSSTTGSSSTSGSSTSGTSGSGTSSTTGSSTTGSSTTGSSTTGSSTTGSSTTGSSTTGSSTTGSSTTGSSTTGSSTTGSSTTGSSTTGSSTTGSSTTGSSTTGSSTTGSSTTGSSTTGTSSSGSSTGGTTGGGSGGGACSGLFTPTPPPTTFTNTSCNGASAQPVYTLTTLAIAPNGARRMLQYEIARITLPPVPAALTMVGPTPNFGTPHSNNFGINGNDGCSASGHTQVNLPAIGTTTDVAAPGDSSATDTANKAASSIAGAIAKPANFTGVGCSAGDDVQNVINVAPSYNTVDGLNAVVQSIIGSADEVATSGAGVSNWGTDANPKVIAITGDATLSSGAGILLVTGNATASGGFSWDGVILLIGNGSLTVNGGGNGAINGAMVVANIGDSSYATDPTNYQGHLLPKLGSPTWNWNGGGNNFFQYNSCFTTSASQAAAFKVLTRREIVY